MTGTLPLLHVIKKLRLVALAHNPAHDRGPKTMATPFHARLGDLLLGPFLLRPALRQRRPMGTYTRSCKGFPQSLPEETGNDRIHHSSLR